MELLLPVLILLGLGFLFIDDGENSQTDEQSNTASEGDAGTDQQQPVTPQNNILNFGTGDDAAIGTNGNDIIRGEGGNDVIVAGAGDDNIFAGDGNDTVAGEAGDDRIFLGAGNDVSTNGDVFTDLAVRPSGQPAGGDDLIRGGAGDDRIIDILGSNTLYGDTGNDTLSGRDAEFDQNTPDTLFGGFGNDELRANDGDTLTGGAGVDTFDVEARGTADAAVITDFEAGERLIIREPGTAGPVAMDRISTAVAPNGVDLNILLDDAVVTVLKDVTVLPADAFAMMNSGTESDSGTAQPVIDPVLRGTDGNDELVADQGQTTLIGGDGDDLLSLRPLTSDVVLFPNPLGASDDDPNLTINAGSGSDLAVGGAGDDVIQGGDGNDILVGNDGVDRIFGGNGDDILAGRDFDDSPGDVLIGGNGDDFLLGDARDTLTGDAGDDVFSNVWTGPGNGPVIVEDFEAGSDALELVHKPDVLVNPAGFRMVFAENSEDSVVFYEDDPIFVLKGISQPAQAPSTLLARAANL